MMRPMDGPASTPVLTLLTEAVISSRRHRFPSESISDRHDPGSPTGRYRHVPVLSGPPGAGDRGRRAYRLLVRAARPLGGMRHCLVCRTPATGGGVLGQAGGTST